MTNTYGLPLLMTAEEISTKIKQISARTLKRAAAKGLITGRIYGNKWNFETASVLRWLRVQEMPALAAAPPVKRGRGRPRKEVVTK